MERRRAQPSGLGLGLGVLWALAMGALLVRGARPATTTTEFPEGYAENGTNNGKFCFFMELESSV